MVVWHIVDTIPKLTTTGVFHQHIRILNKDYVVRYLSKKPGGSDYASTAWLYEANRQGVETGPPLVTDKTPKQVIQWQLRLLGYEMDDGNYL